MQIPTWHACLALAWPTCLPWSDGVNVRRIAVPRSSPALQWTVLAGLPLLSLQAAVPFGRLLLFLALFWGWVRNQTVLLHPLQRPAGRSCWTIVLICCPGYSRLLLAPLAQFRLRTLQQHRFFAPCCWCCFAVVQCVRGKGAADIPTVSEAVRLDQLY